MLQADIDQIHALVSKLGGVAERIDGIDVRTKAAELPGALPDSAGQAASGLSQAMTQVSEIVEGAYLKAAERYRQVGTVCTQCADQLNTTDTQFASKLDELDVRNA